MTDIWSQTQSTGQLIWMTLAIDDFEIFEKEKKKKIGIRLPFSQLRAEWIGTVVRTNREKTMRFYGRICNFSFQLKWPRWDQTESDA